MSFENGDRRYINSCSKLPGWKQTAARWQLPNWFLTQLVKHMVNEHEKRVWFFKRWKRQILSTGFKAEHSHLSWWGSFSLCGKNRFEKRDWSILSCERSSQGWHKNRWSNGIRAPLANRAFKKFSFRHRFMATGDACSKILFTTKVSMSMWIDFH